MSGYESIRDWAFDEYDFNKYDTFQSWLDAIESDFDLNGRGIPLRKIFDIQDFIDLENEFNLRKGIEEEEIEEEEEPDIIDFVPPPTEENIIVQAVKVFVEPVVQVVEKVTGFFKGLFRR